jgi:hypothetical protein
MNNSRIPSYLCDPGFWNLELLGGLTNTSSPLLFFLFLRWSEQRNKNIYRLFEKLLKIKIQYFVQKHIFGISGNC